MNIVNRGYLSVRPKAPFFDWANKFEEDVVFSLGFNNEPSLYLIT